VATSGGFRAMMGVFVGISVSPSLTWANTQQAEIALNADNEEVQLFGLIAPNPGLELRMSGPNDLITLDFAEEAGDVWADIRKGFSVPDLETQSPTAHREAETAKAHRG